MKRIRIWMTVLLVTGLALWMGRAAMAQSFTTGFTFSLPEGVSLHHVYVGTQGDGLQAHFEDLFLLPGSTISGAGQVTPAGFEVPDGNSAVNLDPLLLSLGLGAPNPSTRWALFGLYTDSGGTDHLVLGTNADLTGVPFGNLLSFGEAANLGWLASGQFGPEGQGVWGVAEQLGDGGYMRPFGETAQLYYFSDGQALAGGTVSANLLGEEAQEEPGENVVPEPGALAVLGFSTLSLMGYLRRRGKQAS